MQVTTSTERQYGLDWLRIGAFALLILYHIGMFFVPWGWHVKTAEPIAWLEYPMLAINPWRLSLLFVISGVVSRLLLSKMRTPGAFAASRSSRLLIPLLAGVAFFVAPQPWAELADSGRYHQDFGYFWLNDYFEFGDRFGLVLPTWNHLWFVAYLWVYSLALAAAAALPGAWRETAQALFDRIFAGWGLVALPLLWLLMARLLLHPVFGETHALADDPYAHAVYGFAFFFGVGLARSVQTWSAIDRHWRGLLMVALLACAVMLALHGSAWEGEGPRFLKSFARTIVAWTAILGLLGFARRHLHHDGPARRYLTEAIFPYYIAHQTIIVLVGYAMKQQGVGPGMQLAAILAATLAGCALTYELARRVNWLRPLLGLKRA